MKKAIKIINEQIEEITKEREDNLNNSSNVWDSIRDAILQEQVKLLEIVKFKIQIKELE